MAILTSSKLDKAINDISKHSKAFRNMLQEVLISCAYYAFKEGSTTEFNRAIDAAGNGVHVKAITRWIELVSGIGRVYKGSIVLNKAVRDAAGVMDEATFAPYEAKMREVNWWDTAGEQKQESVFDESRYLNTVVKTLTAKGFAGLAAAVKQAELQYMTEQSRLARENDLAVLELNYANGTITETEYVNGMTLRGVEVEFSEDDSEGEAAGSEPLHQTTSNSPAVEQQQQAA